MYTPAPWAASSGSMAARATSLKQVRDVDRACHLGVEPNNPSLRTWNGRLLHTCKFPDTVCISQLSLCAAVCTSDLLLLRCGGDREYPAGSVEISYKTRREQAKAQTNLRSDTGKCSCRPDNGS